MPISMFLRDKMKDSIDLQSPGTYLIESIFDKDENIYIYQLFIQYSSMSTQSLHKMNHYILFLDQNYMYVVVPLDDL